MFQHENVGKRGNAVSDDSSFDLRVRKRTLSVMYGTRAQKRFAGFPWFYFFVVVKNILQILNVGWAWMFLITVVRRLWNPAQRVLP
jgi:hypothetical protein